MPKNKKNTSKYLIRFIEFFFILLILFFTSINLYEFPINNDVLGTSTINTNTTEEKIVYLENIVQNNPLYFDAYTELIRLNIEKNDFENANKYLNTLKTINPNSRTIRILEKELSDLN